MTPKLKVTFLFVRLDMKELLKNFNSYERLQTILAKYWHTDFLKTPLDYYSGLNFTLYQNIQHNML